MGKHCAAVAHALCASVFAVFGFVQLAQADTQAGFQWLSSVMRTTGEVSSATDIAIPLQASSETARAFELADPSSSVPGTTGQYVMAQPDSSTEALARKIAAAVQSGADATLLLGELASHQDSLTGGFAATSGGQPSIIDTAFAVEALALAGRSSSSTTAKALGYLQSRQAADGSWQEGVNVPSVYLTALSLSALQLNAGVYSLGSSIQNGGRYLLASREGDALWREDYLSGVSLISLLATLSDITPIKDSLSALQTRQLADGGWRDGAYTTAVVLRALTLAQLRAGTTQPPSNGTGALEGHVYRAGSEEPIADVAIDVTSVPGLSVKTNGAGYFIVSGLAPGNASLVASKAGYSTASAVAKVISGQVTPVSSLILAAAQETGTIKLHVTDAASGSALAGVAVALSGADTLGGLTNSTGDIEFAGAAVGAYSLTLSRSGYRTVEGSFSLAGGHTMVVNQPLSSSSSSAPSSGGRKLFGTVVDGVSAAPLAGAVFILESGKSAVTDSSGHFVIDEVVAGSYSPTLSATDYESQQHSLVIPAGVNVNLGTLKLFRKTDTPAPGTGTIKVHVTDAASGSALAGVTVALSGADTLDGLTNSTGDIEFAGVAIGAYSLKLSRSGYRTVEGSFSLGGGNTMIVNQPLSSIEGTKLFGTVIDGASAAPLAGALFTLEGGKTAETDSSGHFVIEEPSAGSYSPTLSATGYEPQQYSLVIPAGVSVNLGTLKLFHKTETAAPDSVTLMATVLDSATGQAIAGAQLTIPAQSMMATADAQGQATLSGISSLSFQVEATAVGYSPQVFSLSVSGYGKVATTLKLAPQAEPSDKTVLRGTILDAASGAPLSGASVQVVGTALGATSDASGSYQISDVQTLKFELRFTALDYDGKSLSVELPAKGTYRIDATLDPAATEAVSGFQVLSVDALDAGKGAFETQRFEAQVGYDGAEAQEALVLGNVLDADGRIVGTISPYASGTETPQASFMFAPGEIKSLQLGWDPAQLPPAAYSLQLTVVKPGTISRAVPGGTVLAERSVYTQVSATQALAGTLSFDPPAAQAGSSTPVKLAVLVANAGNVPLVNQPLTLTIKRPSDGAVLYTAHGLATELPVGNFEEISFGDWIPSSSGNLDVVVLADAADVGGQVSDTYYVGDRPQGSFAVTPTTVYIGTQKVHGTVNVSGVDARLGVSDPLVYAIRQAVEKGSQYVAAGVVDWKNRGQCLGCHIVTQSSYGLSSLLRRDIGVNAAAAQFASNALMSSQNDDNNRGGLFSSTPGFNTQTMLGAWALSQMPDKLDSFRTQYRAAQYLDQRRTDTGNTTRWQGDHDAGWWAGPEAHTMLAVTGLVSVLDTAAKNDVSAVLDYQVENGKTIAYGTLPQRLRSGPDGALYAIQWYGQIVRIEPGSMAQTLKATVSGGQCRSLAVSNGGDIYALCAGKVTKIANNGAQQLIATLGSAVYDIAIGPDDALYASDSTGNRILKRSGAGTFDPWVSGGLLNGPAGLDIAPDGTVRVANSRSYNILKIAPDKTFSTWSEGLSFQPLWLSPAADGGAYATHAAIGGVTKEGIVAINAQGRARRLLTLAGPNVAMTPTGVFATSGTSNTLYQLASHPLDTSQLPTLRTRVEGAARYFLSLNNSDPNNTNNISQAMRMTGLAEAARVITDSTLLSQIDQAMQAIDARLRTRQRSDGGWGRSTSNVSDPMVTALVGMALDYRNPASNDAKVIKAVQYLLNTQNADKSWRSTNNILTTRLAATSLVMAYLPRAMDRLGGLSVDLRLDLPGNIKLSQPSVPLTASSVLPDGGSAFTWSLPGVTSQGRVIEFDLTLEAMQADETRPAASAAYLLSANSFNNDQLRVDLPIPAIRATDGLALISVATDKPQYRANETAQLQTQVTSTAPVTVSGNVVFSIYASADQSLVTRLPAVPFSGLAPGQTLDVGSAWPVGTTVAGPYEVVAELFDAAGHEADEKKTGLSILSSTEDGNEVTVSLRVTTGKQTYNTTDRVAIGDLIRNLSVNAAVPDARLQLILRQPDGSSVHVATISLGELAPGAVREAPSNYKLAAALQGDYEVEGRVLDRAGQLLATDSAGFQVVENLAMTIVGSEAVKEPWLYQGDPQTCTDGVSNRGTQSANGLGLRQRIIDLDHDRIERQTSLTADLPAGSSRTYIRNFTTETLAVGHHACVIEALINGSYKPLATAVFEVKEPPIRINASMALGSKGRILVLMDGAPVTGSSKTEPEPTQQRLFLEKLLTREGWSYTIVTDPEAFAWELRSGDYSTYALFSESAKLAETVQKELREAVYRGEGLLEAGAHDQRHQKFDDALGTKYVGKQSGVTGIEITATEALPAGYVDLQLRDKPLTAQLTAAHQLGHYLGGKTSDALAVASRSYGRGRSMYFGYDLLAEATLGGDSSFNAQLIIRGLSYVQPAYQETLAGRVVPIRITLQNEGIATPGELVLPMPSGAGIVDRGTAVVRDGALVWSYDLAVDEEKTFTAWIRLPLNAGGVSFTAQVFTGTPPQLSDHTTTTLTLQITADAGLAEARQFAASASDYKQVLLWLDKADAALQSGDAEAALGHLAKATDELLKLTNVPTHELRLMIDRALLDAGRRYWSG